MKTPYFLIHQDNLNMNILEFREALRIHWPNSILSYSIKTNSLPWILKYMKTQGIYAEAVSDEEYQLAKLCGYNENEIVFNGPIKTQEQLVRALKMNSIVNLDSKNDLKTLEENKVFSSTHIGIRINLDTSYFCAKDIGFEKDGFRFGFSEENDELKEAIKSIRCIYGDNARFGLHLHCNSITRSINVYKSIAKYASYLIKKYNLNPSFIDVGGGFFGGIEGKPTPDDYVKAIKEILCDVIDVNDTTLILEPGSAFIGSVVDLYTSVIDTKEIKNARIITTDGSRIHIDPLWKKTEYMYSLETREDMICSKKQIICGYTCMDHDRLMSLENKVTLNIKDKIIYHRVGAYSMTFGGMFIRYYPDVYVKMHNQITKVRQRIDVDKYYEIQNVRGK